jgi:enoyl-CoA hydratase/carnithine racemase
MKLLKLQRRLARCPDLFVIFYNIAISCKDVVNTAYETTLSQGLNYEKRVFWATFGTEDRKIGMEAFANKKTPEYKNN